MKVDIGVPWMYAPSISRHRRPSLTMRQCLVWLLSLVVWFTGAPALAGAAKCRLREMVSLPITMSDLRPMMSAKINGTDVRFSLDSGAFFSMISPASAAELKLRTYPAAPGFYVSGIGGRIHVDLTKADNFELTGISLHDVEFMVGGNDESGESIGLLGRNFLQIADVEFDLAQGVVRLMFAKDCGDTALAYWAHVGDSYSVMNIEEPHQYALLSSRSSKAAARYLEPITGTAYVNGVQIRVLFDTGAPNSYLTVGAAAKAGIKVGSPAVVSAGYGGGIGRGQVANYLAQVASFKIGDEEVRNTQLRLGDTTIAGADMLIGADFFLSHHIYVANSQHKLYFTYNGGPVFNLKTVAAASTQSPPATPAGVPTDGARAVQSPAELDAQSATAQSSDARGAGALAAQKATENQEASATRDTKNAGDADDYARRGAAFAARREFDQALPALTRACELATDNPDYFYQRGFVYWQIKQPSNALADFDRALRLKPNHILALLARGDLRMQTGDKAGAEADLDAANAAAPKEDAVHFSLAAGYMRLEQFPRAIEQYDLWIASHPLDAKLYGTLNLRCRARALGGIDLQRALQDCNQALSHAVKSSPFYADAADSRGLVWLRLGDYDKSVADFDACLKIAPRDAWSLYGRGIDKMRTKRTSEGEADIAQAKAISADIGDTFGRYGILP
jgi:tetratricopeptide (TPR) repeat protein/predicted aspartyl protease